VREKVQAKQTLGKTGWGMLALALGIGILFVGCFARLAYRADPYGYKDEALTACREVTAEAQVFRAPYRIAIYEYGAGSWDHISPEKIGYREAQAVEELDAVVCLEKDTLLDSTCRYNRGGTRERRKRIWRAKIIDWPTRQVMATRTFEGPSPGPCPARMGRRFGVSDIFGEDPSLEQVGRWLDTLSHK
jgi:hypothetical protein